MSTLTLPNKKRSTFVGKLLGKFARAMRGEPEHDAEQVDSRLAGMLEPVDGAAMWVDGAYRAGLEQIGLCDVAAVMAHTDGKLLRALPERENWRLEIDGPHTGPRGAYLKKHRVGSWRERVRLGAAANDTPGRVEARNIVRLAENGVPAMRLIAYGERRLPTGQRQSFVLTEELAGYTQLDHFLRARFPLRDAERTKADEHDLKTLLRDVAALAARFHGRGFNHRDLYCCHFFIREPRPGVFEARLIDLQRVQHRRRRRRRWIVKDLAQLAYSAPPERVGCTDRLRFIKHYLGVKKLRPVDKRLIRAVAAKHQLMERRLGAHP